MSYDPVRKELGQIKRMAKAVDPNFDVNDRPQLNVSAPPGSGVRAGASPESIRDNKLRLEYEEAIAQNAAKARRYNQQLWLTRNVRSFNAETERFLVDAYTRPPAEPQELTTLLSRYVSEANVREDILEQVRKKANPN